VAVTTNTFVDEALLSDHQANLRQKLTSFVERFPEVIAENDYCWKFSFGLDDTVVKEVARTFKIKAAEASRFDHAIRELDDIVCSDLWRRVETEHRNRLEKRKPLLPKRPGDR
jgi:hypothetical protein